MHISVVMGKGCFLWCD